MLLSHSKLSRLIREVLTLNNEMLSAIIANLYEIAGYHNTKKDLLEDKDFIAQLAQSSKIASQMSESEFGNLINSTFEQYDLKEPNDAE